MTNSLIKQYSKEPNEKQKEALTRAFKVLALYHLLAGDTVTIRTTNYYNDTSLLASLIVNDCVVCSRKVGVNGGLVILGGE
tara:strand:- start:29784 stop:30026 length:243 start_codon:yes stop_codon:yes gene_type:complete